MDQWQTFWSAFQQAVWIAYGPGLLWVLGGAIAGVTAVAAWDLGTALFRKYFG
jgi:hypothetical protein